MSRPRSFFFASVTPDGGRPFYPSCHSVPRTAALPSTRRLSGRLPRSYCRLSGSPNPRRDARGSARKLRLQRTGLSFFSPCRPACLLFCCQAAVCLPGSARIVAQGLPRTTGYSTLRPIHHRAERFQAVIPSAGIRPPSGERGTRAVSERATGLCPTRLVEGGERRRAPVRISSHRLTPSTPARRQRHSTPRRRRLPRPSGTGTSR